MAKADLIVTNFNPNFTGVSATAAAVVRLQQLSHKMYLAGRPLPGCDAPVSRKAAVQLAKNGPQSRPCQIWHVRRNSEMQTALFARDILRLPIKIVFTSAAQRRHSWWPRCLIARMDAVIATSDAAASYVDRVYATVPHGVDTALFHPADDRGAAWKRTGYSGTIGIGCIGRIRPEKGTDRFVDAAIDIASALPDVTALVIGKAKREHQGYLRDLKQKVAEAGLEKRILFIGEVAPTKLPALVRALSLLLALPRYEGYGMTPLEAMASGVPIIATDTGHFKQFVGDGQAGLVLDTDDPADAARAAVEILQSRDALNNLSKTCVSRARSEFGIEREVSAINAVYEQVWNGETKHLGIG